jgi:hypothetical protein
VQYGSSFCSKFGEVSLPVYLKLVDGASWGNKTATATVMVRGRRVTVPRQSWARALKRRWPLLVNVFLLVLADCPPHAVLDLPRLNPCYAD